MKALLRVLLAVSALLALFAVAASSDDRSPVASGIWTPKSSSWQPLHINSSTLINDGGFENGPPPTSAWDETTATVCEWIGDFTTIFGVSPYEGANCLWVGGYCPLGFAAITTVAQTVTIPAGVAGLSFWYMEDRGDPDDEGLDVAYIQFDGTEIWSLPLSMASSTGLTWVNHVVDISAYAGQTVRMRLGNRAVGLTGNVLLDFFELVTPAGVSIHDSPVGAPRLAASVARGRKVAIDLALPDAAVVDVGVYSVDGRRIAELARGWRPAGRSIDHWDGGSVARGIYFVRAVLRTGGRTVKLSSRVVLVH